jgi:predicted GNAT family acetyltransferase
MATVVPEGEWLSFPATLEDAAALVPPTLRVTLQGTLVQMVGPARIAVPKIEASPALLSEADAEQMLHLADLARPGPFRARTHSLGTYLGIRVDGRLVAMAGERMRLPGHCEVSGVSTLPDFRGRGYARLLVALLSNKIRDEGLTPFLHVEESNVHAQTLYSTLGFVERRRLPLLVVTRA